SHLLGDCDELIKALGPALVESHFLMPLSSRLVLVDGNRGIFRPLSMGLEQDDRGEERIRRRPVARSKRVGEDEFFVLDYLKIATDAWRFLSFRRPHYGAKHTTRTKIYFAIGSRPRRRCEPLLDVFRLGPCSPNQSGRDIDHTLQH